MSENDLNKILLEIRSVKEDLKEYTDQKFEELKIYVDQKFEESKKYTEEYIEKKLDVMSKDVATQITTALELVGRSEKRIIKSINENINVVNNEVKNQKEKLIKGVTQLKEAIA